MRIKAFRGYRPGRDKIAMVASRPYDVLTTAEARLEAAGNPYSFLNIVKPEIGFPPGADPYSPAIYRAAAANFRALINDGTFVRDEHECLYIYEMSRDKRLKTGIVAAAAVEDYINGSIRKHEQTRPDKETDRANHIRTTMLNAEPVMFAYRYDGEIDDLVEAIKTSQPEYDITDADEVQHRFWIVDKPETVAALVLAFSRVPATYVADGHHRTAAAAVVSRELNEQGARDGAGPGHNYFLAVHFPDNQLEILDYNRLVADLNGLDKEIFLQELETSFSVEKTGGRPVGPDQHNETGMYLAGDWYRLIVRPASMMPPMSGRPWASVSCRTWSCNRSWIFTTRGLIAVSTLSAARAAWGNCRTGWTVARWRLPLPSARYPYRNSWISPIQAGSCRPRPPGSNRNCAAAWSCTACRTDPVLPLFPRKQEFRTSAVPAYAGIR